MAQLPLPASCVSSATPHQPQHRAGGQSSETSAVQAGNKTSPPFANTRSLPSIYKLGDGRANRKRGRAGQAGSTARSRGTYASGRLCNSGSEAAVGSRASRARAGERTPACLRGKACIAAIGSWAAARTSSQASCNLVSGLFQSQLPSQGRLGSQPSNLSCLGPPQHPARLTQRRGLPQGGQRSTFKIKNSHVKPRL